VSATRAVLAAVAVVLGVELATLMTTGARTTHLLPGGFTLFGVLGALALVRVAKAIGALGVQQPAPDDHDE
jgi:formate hydrogenlyase subunit 4